MAEAIAWNTERSRLEIGVLQEMHACRLVERRSLIMQAKTAERTSLNEADRWANTAWWASVHPAERISLAWATRGDGRRMVHPTSHVEWTSLHCRWHLNCFQLTGRDTYECTILKHTDLIVLQLCVTGLLLVFHSICYWFVTGLLLVFVTGFVTSNNSFASISVLTVCY